MLNPDVISLIGDIEQMETGLNECVTALETNDKELWSEYVKDLRVEYYEAKNYLLADDPEKDKTKAVLDYVRVQLTIYGLAKLYIHQQEMKT